MTCTLRHVHVRQRLARADARGPGRAARAAAGAGAGAAARAGRRGRDPRRAAGGDLGRAHPRRLRPRPGLLRRPDPHRARRQRRESRGSCRRCRSAASASSRRSPPSRAANRRRPAAPATATVASLPPGTGGGIVRRGAGRAAWLTAVGRPGRRRADLDPRRHAAAPGDRRRHDLRQRDRRSPRSTASSRGLSDLVVSRLTELAPDRVGVVGNAAALRQPRAIRNLEGAGRCARRPTT